MPLDPPRNLHLRRSGKKSVSIYPRSAPEKGFIHVQIEIEKFVAVYPRPL